MIDFSGYQWSIKASAGAVGPGPNVFSVKNVCVDDSGALQLAIVKRGNTWTSAEVGLTRSLGYGKYQWHLDSDVTQLAPEAVLGLFTWSDAPAHAHREIDIEFSRWGDAGLPTNGWHTVQNGQAPSSLTSHFELPAARSSVHTLHWHPGRVEFRSEARGSVEGWTCVGREVPIAGDETPRMNLWLHAGQAPSDGQLSIAVRSFGFLPF